MCAKTCKVCLLGGGPPYGGEGARWGGVSETLRYEMYVVIGYIFHIFFLPYAPTVTNYRR